MNAARSYLGAWLIALVPLAVLAAFFVGPMIYMGAVSFYKNDPVAFFKPALPERLPDSAVGPCDQDRHAIRLQLILFRVENGNGRIGTPSSTSALASSNPASPWMARSGASPSCIRRASLANSRPT